MASPRSSFRGLSDEKVCTLFESALNAGEFDTAKALIDKYPGALKFELGSLWSAILSQETHFKIEVVEFLAMYTPDIGQYDVHKKIASFSLSYGEKAAVNVIKSLTSADDISFAILSLDVYRDVSTIKCLNALDEASMLTLSKVPFEKSSFTHFFSTGQNEALVYYIENSPHMSEEKMVEMLETVRIYSDVFDFDDVKRSLFNRLEKIESPKLETVEAFISNIIFSAGVEASKVFDLMPTDYDYTHLFTYVCVMNRKKIFEAMEDYGIESKAPYLDLPEHTAVGKHADMSDTYMDYLSVTALKDIRDTVEDLPDEFRMCERLDQWRDTIIDEWAQNGLYWAAKSNTFYLVTQSALDSDERLSAKDIIEKDSRGHSPLMILAARGRFTELLNEALWQDSASDVDACFSALPKRYQRIYADDLAMFKASLRHGKVKANHRPSIKRRPLKKRGMK